MGICAMKETASTRKVVSGASVLVVTSSVPTARNVSISAKSYASIHSAVVLVKTLEARRWRRLSAAVQWEVHGEHHARNAHSREHVIEYFLRKINVIILNSFLWKSLAEFEKLCPSGAGRGPKGEDLNECNVMPGICEGGECVNTDGSFRCECPMGFVLDSSGRKCVGTNRILI